MTSRGVGLGRASLALARLRFADPLFLLRVRGFIDWQCHNGHAVRVVRPRSVAVRNYLARMALAEDFPPGCECDLGKVPAQNRRSVLIPIRRLTSNLDSEDVAGAVGRPRRAGPLLPG